MLISLPKRRRVTRRPAKKEQIVSFSRTAVTATRPSVNYLQLTNKSITRLVNVYQERYTNKNAPGIGDYIRGSFCLLQICIAHGLRFDMNLTNHPISKFLTTSPEQQMESIDFNQVGFYQESNFPRDNRKFHSNFINYINGASCNNGTHYLLTNAFHISEITPFHKKVVRSKLEPNEFLKTQISFVMEAKDLIPKEYETIHIRTGDRYLVHKIDIHKNEHDIIGKVSQVIQSKINMNRKTLLVSDCSQLKHVLLQRFPQLVAREIKITHIGEGVKNNDTTVLSTLIDFFLLANSSKIISMSPYGHGTGFSQQCSILYDIPCDFVHLDIPPV